MTAQKILIIGGDSKIGQAVGVELKKSGCEVIITTRRKHPVSTHTRYLDLCKPLSQWEPPEVDACLLAGAVTSLQTCQQHPEYCEKVNVIGTLQVAEKLLAQGTYVLFLSSNQVFDGTNPYVGESTAVKPLTWYGKHKAFVESRLLPRNIACGILRLSKVLADNNGLLNSWFENLSHGQVIKAFDNYYMAPVSMEYTSRAIAWMLQNRLPGIFHLSGDKDISYFEVAQLLAGLMERKQLVKRDCAKKSSHL
ncbi:sugar nucleotide-binding protein, partial [Kaarinaea lacus]